jgi:transposase
MISDAILRSIWHVSPSQIRWLLQSRWCDGRRMGIGSVRPCRAARRRQAWPARTRRGSRGPPPSPDQVGLTEQQRHDLYRLTRAGRTQQRLAQRARIVLLSADGHSNTGIAADLGVCPDTVRKWRHRWCLNPGLTSLGDAARSGRPPRFTPVQVARVKALACTHPADHALPLSRWSCPDLARQAVTSGICRAISSSTVRRWLVQDPIKPWQFQSWIFITDPDFERKAKRALDLSPAPS